MGEITRTEIELRTLGSSPLSNIPPMIHSRGSINITSTIQQGLHAGSYMQVYVRGDADKSLVRPGRKHATATKLGIYSTYSSRSSIHFLALCSNFCKLLKKYSECYPSNQVSAAVMTSASDEKWRPFNCFFSPRNRW